MAAAQRRRPGVLRAGLVLWALVPAVAALAQTPDAAGRVARLEAATAALEREIELASGTAFYLVLDPAVSELALKLRGAELRRYAILSLQLGRRRVAFARRGETGGWRGVIWTQGRLDPPREADRIEIAPPPAGAGEAASPPVPPTPEEAVPVPFRYHIRFEGGPAIEIWPREADTSTGRWARFLAWWVYRWHDTVDALRPPAGELVRLRLVLAPEDADALYRSLPPDPSLLVLPPAPAGGGR